jgi:putative endonuclease
VHPWLVYMLRCGDGTLYVGVTNRFAERIAAHRSGTGARYTRGRGPLEVLYLEHAGERGEALRREHWLKGLTRRDKLRLAGVA